MTISDLCIKRPVFTWVLVAMPVVLGLLKYFELGVDLFPNVEFPVCTVTTVLTGASVEEMETSVTKPIEDIVNTISGIEELRSVTMEGVSLVTVQFNLNKNGDVGAQEVRDKVGSILATLPDGTETPIVDRFETGSIPVLTLTVSGQRDIREVTEIARKQLKERLETVDGVGAIQLVGGRTRAINIVIDTDKLASYSLSIEDVRMALTRQNLEVPGGRIDQGPRELVLRTLGRLNSAAEFNNLIISNRGGYPIRVKDIGNAEDSVEEPRSLARLDGQNAVSLVVQKQSGTNSVKVADGVLKRLEEIRPNLPPDLIVEITRDQSRFIRRSIEEVQFHLLLAAALVGGTIFLFIRDWRTTLIATLAIPTSIIPTFYFMHAMGFTLNNITMLGLILAIGIVIDDAVVVHENIFRHMEEEGMDAMEASRLGTREIALPVLATSLSLIVIFLPIAFMGGIVGRFFSSFGLTVAFAVAMSLFVSFTLTPMLCSRFLKLDPSHSGQAKSKSGLVYRSIDRGYEGILRFALRYKPLVIVLAIAVFATTPLIVMKAGFALIPRDDQSEFEISMTTPEGFTLERTDRLVAEIEQQVQRMPDVRYVVSSIGGTALSRAAKGQGDVTSATMYVRLKDIGDYSMVPDPERPGRQIKNSQFLVQNRVRSEILANYPDLRASVNDVSAFQGGKRAQIFQMNLAGPDLSRLEQFAQTISKKLKDQGGVTDVDTSLSLRKPEIQVAIDREAASDLGIPIGTIADSLRILVGGLPVSKYRDGTDQWDVWLRAETKNRSTTKELYQLTMPSPTVGLVKLSSLAQLQEKQGPTEIERLSRDRIVTILANPGGGVPLGEVVSRSNAIVDEMKAKGEMPPEYGRQFTGQAKTLGEVGFYFMQAFLLAVTFMFLILAAQFESWFQPISILMALPVTVPFGLLSLWLWGTPIDLYALFGLFMLAGIVKKNGILQVDATNQNRKHTANREEAILRANRTRFRPILMTTMMLVAAMVPIAMGQGPGSGSRASMAKVIIGGQMLSLVLALIVTPVFYIYLDNFTNFLNRLRGLGEPHSREEQAGPVRSIETASPARKPERSREPEVEPVVAAFQAGS